METPGRTRRPRKSIAPNEARDSSDTSPEKRKEKTVARARGTAKRANDGAALNGSANGAAKKTQGERDPRIDYDPDFAFGGSMGVSAMMIGFPLLMWYMWIGATYYDGHLPTPAQGQNFQDFLKRMVHLVFTGAFPSLRAWTIYWGFLIFQAVCYIYLPGITVQGKRLEHEGGKRLDYYCSGLWSLYTTIAVALALHFSGLLKLYTIIDEFGPIMSVAIISGFLVSIIAYISAFIRGAQHRMTGYHIYDFFMGAELNPRIFAILDLKMFFEVRLPWYLMFLVTAGTAARQYELYEFVPLEVCFMLMAHFLYANACSKAEEAIVTTW